MKRENKQNSSVVVEVREWLPRRVGKEWGGKEGLGSFLG